MGNMPQGVLVYHIINKEINSKDGCTERHAQATQRNRQNHNKRDKVVSTESSEYSHIL